MRYQNQTDRELTIPGVGVVQPGGTIDTDVEISNPNLTVTGDAPSAPEAHSEPEADQEGTV